MKRIPIAGKGGIGDHCKATVNELIQETVLTLDRKIKLKSPVDTGRFRMSWQVGQDRADGGFGVGPVGLGVSKIDRINYGKEKIGHTYWIHSNLPYSEPVAAGTNLPPSWGGVYRSKWGLTSGWIQRIALIEAKRVKINWARIVRT